MPEYFRIVYVNTRSEPSAKGAWPKDIQNLRDWTWLQSALVRWEYVRLEKEGSADLDALLLKLATARLLVLDWSCPNPLPAIELYTKLREVYPTLPILVVDYSSGREPIRDDSLQSDSCATIVSEADLGEPRVIRAALRQLAVALPPPAVRVNLEAGGVVIQSLIESLGNKGEKRLAMVVQKFFPDATIAQVEPVGGGWSGARLVRLFVQGQPDPFFLKFFISGESYESELRQHDNAARQWLHGATVKVLPVPGLCGNLVNQIQAFPTTNPCVFPVCYESASTKDHPRETLKEFYRTADETKLEKGLRRLLAILSTDQPATPPEDVGEPPWSPPGMRGFCLTREFKESLLATLDDLSRYGERTWDDWDRRRDSLQRLVHELPLWLTEWLRVLRGYSHGDPNPRNCLIARDNPEDLVLIDCGNYRTDGRLVSDLAIVERDVKLVMMGSEEQAHDFYDLDIRQLVNWYQAERIAMGNRLDYTPGKAIVLGGPYCSATRAHRLVGLVRQEAQNVCGTWDPKGRHYFAALLYWTLEILHYPAVRRTKKLLALYSASEILLSM